MELMTSLLIGLGLSAACGFRVFVPPLVMSAAALSGQLTLAPEFAWIGTYPALIAFGAATMLEVGGYYVPWLDNLLDAVATPTAVVAGTIVTASMVSDMGPLLTWSIAVIGGGGVAGVVQGGTVLIRGTSTATTAGLGNPGVSTGEAVGSVVLSVLAIAAPLIGAVLVALLLIFAVRRIVRWRRRRAQPQSPSHERGQT